MARSVWVREGDVEGPIEAGSVVELTRDIEDWYLRGDDGSAPLRAGSLVRIVDVRPWGAAEAVERIAARPKRVGNGKWAVADADGNVIEDHGDDLIGAALSAKAIRKAGERMPGGAAR